MISVEIDPPRSVRIERTIEAARLLQDAGADLVNISDSAMARVRMGAMAVAFGIQHDLDLECVVHVTTRDRNLMALESELLGAHALGVRNILALTGDPPRIGDYPTGSGVWDVDSIGLIEILTRLNRGEDQAGSPIGQQATFTIACALDPTAADTKTEWDRLERKLAAGAHLVMTQPLYDARAGGGDARRVATPLRAATASPSRCCSASCRSSRLATPSSCTTRCPGITIPEATRARMRAAGAAGTEAGIDMADALLAAVGGEVSGTYLMPSFGRYEQAAELVRRIRVRHPVEAAAGLRDGSSRVPRFVVTGGRARRPGNDGHAALAASSRASQAAGPPFPPPVEDQAVYDTAGAFRPATVEQVEATIDAIEQRTGAEVVVYTQLVPCCETTDEAEHNARALMDQWGVGRRGFDDGLVILFDLREDDPCHGQVQLYAGPGYAATFLSNAERQAIFENDMLPLLSAATSTARCSRRWRRSTRRRRRSTPRSSTSSGILNAVLGLLVAPLAVRADRRRRADRVVSATAATRSTSTTRRSTSRPRRPASPRRPARSSATGSRRRRALTTASLDLAARGLIAFDAEAGGPARAHHRGRRSTPRRRPPTTRSRWRGSIVRAPGRSTTRPRSCSSDCARSAAGPASSTPRSC